MKLILKLAIISKFLLILFTLLLPYLLGYLLKSYLLNSITNKSLITVKSDHKFNIYIDLNILKEDFLNSYKINSLKECNYTFEK